MEKLKLQKIFGNKKVINKIQNLDIKEKITPYKKAQRPRYILKVEEAYKRINFLQKKK